MASTLLEMEDNFNFEFNQSFQFDENSFKNVYIWKMTSTFLDMEDNFNYLYLEDLNF